MSNDPLKVPACAHCGSSASVKLRKHIIANGKTQIAWWCIDCERWALKPPHWIKHALVAHRLEKQGATIDDIPAIADHSDATPCIICGEPGEVHHWAPQAYRDEFGDDWWAYPTAHLCDYHHKQWHKIVTPQLNGGHPDAEMGAK